MIQLEIILLGVKIEIWALIISLIALIFTLMKDFIIPWILKPRLKFDYKEERPFRRENVIINRNNNNQGCFFRFSIKNVGSRPAINCRCQIFKVETNSTKYGDYQGFPLRWASRPESIIDSTKGERLNIAVGETEFIDLAVTANTNTYINLQKYHSVDIGIKEVIEPGQYVLTLIFSGDNFKPYKIKFEMTKENNTNPNEATLKLIKTSK